MQKCIYSAMLTDQKLETHHKVALSLKAILDKNQSQKPLLLPLIAFHFEHTKDVQNRIRYLDLVSEHYVDIGSYNEALVSLTKLFDLIQAEERRIEKEKGPKLKFDDNPIKWHTVCFLSFFVFFLFLSSLILLFLLQLFGIAYVGRSEWSKGQKHLFDALKLLGFDFPGTQYKVNRALTKCYSEQKTFWKNKDENFPPKITKVEEIERVKHLCDVLNALNTCFTFIGNNKSAELCLLLQLNFCESIGLDEAKAHKLHFGQIEASMAMLFWMRNKRSLALEYFSRAKSICEYSGLKDDLQTFYTLRATMLLSSGRIKEASDNMKEVLDEQRKRTAGTSTNAVYLDIALISLLDGQFEDHQHDIVTVYEAATDNNDDSTQVEAACSMIQCLLLAPPHYPEGTTDVNNWVSAVEEMATTWADAHSSHIHLMNISSALTLFYATRDAQKAVAYGDQFLAALSKSQPRLRSPLGYLISVYILFYLLAQHHLFVINREAPISLPTPVPSSLSSPPRSSDAKSTKSGKSGRSAKSTWKVKEATKSLKQVLESLEVLQEWWSFVTPIIALAEGMIALFKGEKRAAVKEWRKGLKKTDEISDNLKFLRAILQARVVRYAVGNDPLKAEATEFLQRVGARFELALVNGESLVHLPAIEEEEEEENLPLSPPAGE